MRILSPLNTVAISVIVGAVGLVSAAIAASPKLDCRVSWIGNTFPGATKWVQQDIEAMCVTPDGTVFTNVAWEEGGGNCGQYKDGDVLGFARHTHGWGAGGGQAVAANSKYVFIGMQMSNEGGGLQDPETWPPKGFYWSGVFAPLASRLLQGGPIRRRQGGQGRHAQAIVSPGDRSARRKCGQRTSANHGNGRG